MNIIIHFSGADDLDIHIHEKSVVLVSHWPNGLPRKIEEITLDEMIQLLTNLLKKAK